MMNSISSIILLKGGFYKHTFSGGFGLQRQNTTICLSIICVYIFYFHILHNQFIHIITYLAIETALPIAINMPYISCYNHLHHFQTLRFIVSVEIWINLFWFKQFSIIWFVIIRYMYSISIYCKWIYDFYFILNNLLFIMWRNGWRNVEWTYLSTLITPYHM